MAAPTRSNTSLEALDVAAFRRAVLDWFDSRGRVFPFRGTKDPYLVLVAETLLQQTQISRGGPAWVRFTEQFPTVESLAAATPAAVLRAWQGLGYNRRAINLHRAARIVVDELSGVLPRDVAGLEHLSGVGPYTARAVASIAYRTPVGAVDTNVRRVLGRVLAGDPTQFTARDLQAAADEIVDPDQPDDWTPALMDIGSTLCRPARPLCPDCPVVSFCRYAAGDRPEPGGRAKAPSAGGVKSERLGPGMRSSARPTDFAATTRWLRGRILDRLREAPGDAWSTFDEPIGGHDRTAIASALEAMERDGLVELNCPSNPDTQRTKTLVANRDAGAPPGLLLARLPIA